MAVYVQIPGFPKFVQISDSGTEDVADAVADAIAQGKVVSWHLPNDGGVYIQNFGQLPGIFVRNYLLPEEEEEVKNGSRQLVDISLEQLTGGHQF